MHYAIVHGFVITGQPRYYIWMYGLRRLRKWHWVNGLRRSARLFRVMASSLVTEYRRANICVSSRTRIPLTTTEQTWKPPVQGCIKVNTDASVINGLETGIGGVARDHHGLAIWCFMETKSGELDVDSAEALAVLRATKRALELNVRILEVETDSQTLYMALQNPKVDLSFFGQIVRDILALRSFFERLSFSWIRRVGNSVAHSLAVLTRTIDGPFFSLSLPTFCMNEYYIDLQNY
ncbi:hypothetical protein ACS0TY_008905 [Phlomoides rotata]